MSGLRAIVSDVRKRLFPILIAFAIGAIASFQIMDGVLQQVIAHTKPAGASIVYLTPLEVIMLKLKMAMICGVLLAILTVIYSVYRSIRRSTRGRAVGLQLVYPRSLPQWYSLLFCSCLAFCMHISSYRSS